MPEIALSRWVLGNCSRRQESRFSSDALSGVELLVLALQTVVIPVFPALLVLTDAKGPTDHPFA